MLAARSIDKLEELAEELGGPDHAVAVECDVTEWADQQAAVTVALEHFGRLDAAWANAGFGAAAELPRRHRRALARDGAHERLRRGADDSCDAAGAEGDAGASPAHRLGRRASTDPRVALLRDEARGARDGRVVRLELDGTGVRVTVIAPGMVDTPFFDNVPLEVPLEPDDVARAVLFALSQPPHVDVNEILVRPTAQPH